MNNHDLEEPNIENIAEELQQRTSLLHEDRIVGERSAGIHRIHQQVSQVNSLFKDLSRMVISQGESLTSIEKHFSDASGTSNEASKQLRIARDRQKYYSNIMTVLVVLIFGALGLIIYKHTSASIVASVRHHPQG